MKSRREFLELSLLASAAWASGAGASPRKDGGASPTAHKKLLILGGTGYLGPEMVASAKARGYTITLFNRGKTHPGMFPDLEHLLGDRDGKLDALKGRTWDAVVDPSGYFPRLVHDSATLLKNAVKHYIYISSLSVFAQMNKDGLDESGTLQTLPPNTPEKITPDTYGAFKAACERAAQASIPEKVTIVRPGLISGPNDPTDRFTYWPARVSQGGEVLAPGNPGDTVQLVDVRDLAEFILGLVDQRVLGVFNAVGPREPLSMQTLLATCKKVSGSNASFTWVNAKFLDGMNVSPWSDMPVWLPPGTEGSGMTRINNHHALDAGLKFRPLEETVRDTLAWWKTQPPERRAKLRAGVSSEREKEVLAAFHKRSAK